MGLSAVWLSGFELRQTPGLCFVAPAHSSPAGAHSLDFAGPNDISLRAEGRSSLARCEWDFDREPTVGGTPAPPPQNPLISKRLNQGRKVLFSGILDFR